MARDDSDSDTDIIASTTTPTPNPVLQASAASLIQRIIRGNISRAQLSATMTSKSTTTSYEFPGGFKVAIDVAKPITNTDGDNAGRLYKKENRPVEGSKEEKELLTDIKVNRYPKYKVLNVSLKDPEKLASNLSILDNLNYTEQFMIEFNMEDPFRTCFPDNAALPASLEVDSKGIPKTKNLFKEHRDISVEEVGKSNRWYSRYAIFTDATAKDRSFAKELEWSLIHFRNHVDQELYNVVHSEYISFPPEERGGPLFLKLLLLHLVYSNEANLEILINTVKTYKINENVENEDMDKVIRLLKAVTDTILHLRNTKTLPEKYTEHLCTALQTTSCAAFNEEIAGLEKDVTTSRRIRTANQSPAMRRHSSAASVAPTLTGLILENTPQGVDFIFSFAQSTYRDLKDSGKWDAAMRPAPGGAGADGTFMALGDINGPFCWNCESTDHTYLNCDKPRDQATIAKNRALYREHKGDSRDTSGGRGTRENRWTKWKKPKQDESNKRIINSAPYTWNPTTKRWDKDDTPPSGMTAGTPAPAQSPAEDNASRRQSGNPFPPSMIKTKTGGDDTSVTDTVSQAEISALQLQMANLANNFSSMATKFGP